MVPFNHVQTLAKIFPWINATTFFPPTSAPSFSPTPEPTPELVFDLSPPPAPPAFDCSGLGIVESPSEGICLGNNVLETARENLDLSLFVSLYEITGLEVVFDCGGPFTAVFPTNKAVVALGKDRLTELLAVEYRDQLKELLFYHVLPGEVDQRSAVLSYSQTLSPAETIRVGDAAQTFDNAKVLTSNVSPCNGRVYTIDAVLEPGSEAPSTSPSLQPTLSPTTLAPTTAVPSLAPSAAPTETLKVTVDKFFISYASQNGTDPSPQEFEMLRQVNIEYYTQIFATNYTDFISLDFDLEFTLQDQGFPRVDFNIYTQWLPSVFSFKQGGDPSPEDLMLTLRQGTNMSYIIRVRELVGTAFADVIFAFLFPVV